VFQPYLARITMGGAVAWQHRVNAIDGGEFNYGFAQGNDVYAAGYVVDDINTDIRRSGFLARFASNGTLVWQRSIANATNYAEINGVGLDGVNVVSSGYIDGNDALYLNTDRTGTTFGTASGYAWNTTSLTTSAPTVALKTIQDLYAQAVTFTISDTSSVANQSPSTTTAVVATREGFSGLGRGISFAVDGIIREPKKGSVFQIDGNENTYFIIEVSAYDPVTDEAVVTLDPPVVSSLIPEDNENVTIREAYSQVRMTGHDFLDIGTGGFASTNYPVIIAADYSVQPNPDNEIFEDGGGRCFYVTTDQDGNFRVGPYFKVEQATGRATLSSEEFDLTGLNELQLGSIRAGKRGATISEFSTDGTMGGNSDSVVPTEKAIVTYLATQLASGAAQGFKLKDADDNTTINVDTASDGSANTIVMTTAGTSRLTIGSTGQITASSSYAPSNNYDLATKLYIDTLIGGISQSSIGQNDSNITVTDTGSGSIGFNVDGSSKMTITSSGVNLGAISNVIISGGTNGQALITNGSGVLSFSTVGATLATPSSNSDFFPTFSSGTSGLLTTANVNANFKFNPSSSTLTVTNFVESSSITLKENIRPIENALDKITQLVGVIYDRKDGSKKEEAGLIADDVYNILPNLVTKDADGNIEGLHYTKLSAYIIEAIKEIKDEIVQLKGK
jgi:hypothetical protein